jgi:hypothetical protein
MKIEDIDYEFQDGNHQATLYIDGYELAVDFTEKNPHAIGQYTYDIVSADVLKDGIPIKSIPIREHYLSMKEDLLKKTVKYHLS